MVEPTRTIAAIQARMGSTRLPGKVMMPLHGQPLIWHICDRLKHAATLDEVVIATSVNPGDAVLVEYAREAGIPCFAGSEMDLVERMYLTARKFGATALVRITADCPVVDPRLVDDVVRAFHEGSCDYASNWSPSRRTFPHGFEVEVYAVRCLEHLWREITDSVMREWLPLNIHEHPDRYRMRVLHNDTPMPTLRLTVDYPEDMSLMERLFAALYDGGRIFSIHEILEYLSANPDVARINEAHWGMKGTEGYTK